MNRELIKSLFGQALIRTGLWHRLLGNRARRDNAIILNYHRAIEKWDRTLDYSQPGLVVTADTFDRQLAFLKNYFHIVPLSYFLNPKFEIRNSKYVGRPLCAITFDDGWRDNYEIAFPILQKHDVPATIFLTADFIGTNRAFWHTELIYVLLHGTLSEITTNEPTFQCYPAPVRHRLMRLARITQPLCAQDVDPFIEVVKETCDENTIEAVIRDLAEIVGLPRPFLPGCRFFLDWDHVRELASSGMEIGSHGCTHRALSRMNEEEAIQELIRSKREIENQINQDVKHFAFPYGAWNQRLLDLAVRAGYQTACIGVDGTPQSSDCHVLNRPGAHEGMSAGSHGAFCSGALAFALVRSHKVLAW